MLKTERFIVSSFGTNMYVVSDEDRAILIDPACATPYEQHLLLNYLKNKGLTIDAVVATHGHLDHLWGAAWASRTFALPVRMHEADIPMAQAMQRQYDLFGIGGTPEAFPVEPISPADTMGWFSVIPTPGHTPGGICLYCEQENLLFSGDTLFRYGYGRTDLPGGNTAQLVQSLERLFALPPATRVFPGHGEATTIGAEAR